MAFRAAEYQRYQGQRSRRPSWFPIWKATFRRGWASRWVKWITLGALGLGVAITLVLYFIQKVVPEWRTLMEQMGERVGSGPNLRFDGSVYLLILHWFVYPFLLPISVLLGYDLIAGDLRSNALEAYFSRPISPAGYLFGRTAAFTSFLLLTTLAPLLWIWTFDVSTAPLRQEQRYEITVAPEHVEEFKNRLRRFQLEVMETGTPGRIATHVGARDGHRSIEWITENADLPVLDVRLAGEVTRTQFERVKHVPLGLTAAMVLVALTMALFIQALTTFTRNGTWTALVVLILFFLSGTSGPVLYEITRREGFLAVAFWENIFTVANGFLGFPVSEGHHAPFPLCLGVMLSLMFASLAVLAWRVRSKGVVG